MLAALRFRKGQAFALLLLSACVVASIAFAPLYVGSVDDAVVRARLGEVPAQNHYLSVSGDYGRASSGADGLTPRRDWAELEPSPRTRSASRRAVRTSFTASA